MKSRWEDCRGAVKTRRPCGADQDRIGARVEIRSRRRDLYWMLNQLGRTSEAPSPWPRPAGDRSYLTEPSRCGLAQVYSHLAKNLQTEKHKPGSNHINKRCLCLRHGQIQNRNISGLLVVWMFFFFGIAYIKHINACPEVLQCRGNGPERHGEPGIKCLG